MNYEEKGIELRKDILKMIYTSQSGHPGGSLSCVDILIALYYGVLRQDFREPRMESRDRFVLSKGHGCPALYAVLSDLGYIPREDLWTLRRVDSYLQGHPDMHKIPGIDASTGSLGQGASIALGMALGAKHQKQDYKIYTLVGDGECQEGMIWEMAMAAAHYQLDNFTVILDHNEFQLDGRNEQVMGLGNVGKKFEAFGFETLSVNGHDIKAMIQTFSQPLRKGQPRFVECKTIKGKGVSFMENQMGWHGKAPNEAEYQAAVRELEEQTYGKNA